MTDYEATNTLGPHRHNESWEEYISRRVNDEADEEYLARHQKTEDWVRERIRPDGLLVVNGYLWRDPYGQLPGSARCYDAYLDSRGRKFRVDDWDAVDRTSEPLALETPYLLQHARVADRPDLIMSIDFCGRSLTDELRRLGVMTRNDELVSLAAIPGLEALVGKRVRLSCTVEYIREAYYDGDGCYDRVYLVPEGEAVEVDIWGRSVEEKKRKKEMFQRKAKAVFVDDELDVLMSGEKKE
jgi:hypothetical protein